MLFLFHTKMKWTGELLVDHNKRTFSKKLPRIEKRAVGKKSSETLDKSHFQRHSWPGPDFWSEKGKKGTFKLILLET